MDTEQLSEIITQVLKRMNIVDVKKEDSIKEGSIKEDCKKEYKKKALVIFEDIQKGLLILEDYKQLIEEYDVSLLAVKNTTGLDATYSFERTFVTEDLPSNCNEWIKQFERVLIPSPSLKMVSKLAHIILDDKFTEIIFSALQEKKQVLIGQALDSEKAINFTAPVRTEIQRLADKLKAYGILPLTSIKTIKHCYPITKDIISKTRGVLSLQDVSCIAGNSNELSINKGTVITPLAMDYLREKKIAIKRIS